jgi:hypothetical protein
MKITQKLVLLVTWGLVACVGPTADDVWATPDDIWTWQINLNYQRVAHCLADTLNSATQYSWFFQAPRPITSFEQQWQLDKIVLKSVDPLGVEQVRIQVVGDAPQSTRIIAAAKNLEALGGGAPMYYVRAYVAFCSHT